MMFYTWVTAYELEMRQYLIHGIYEVLVLASSLFFVLFLIPEVHNLSGTQLFSLSLSSQGFGSIHL